MRFSLGRPLVILLFFCVGPLTFAQTPTPPVAALTTLTVTVTNKEKNFVMGLRKENFEVFVDNKPAIVAGVKDEVVPMSIGILWDASGSMGDIPWQKVQSKRC